MNKGLRVKGQGLRFLLCFLFITYHLSVITNSVFAQEEGQFVYDLKGRRDPMIPLVTPQGLIRDLQPLESKDDLYLEGIIYDDEGRFFAIIDGEIVEAGDILGEIKILDIRKDKVIILKDNQTKEIKLEQEEE